MIELVPMTYRIVNEVDGAAAEKRGGKSDGAGSSVAARGGGGAGGGGAGSVESNGHSLSRSAAATSGTAGGSKMDEDEERDAVFFRLEMLGYRVGQGLVERCVLARLLSSPAMVLCYLQLLSARPAEHS